MESALSSTRSMRYGIVFFGFCLGLLFSSAGFCQGSERGGIEGGREQLRLTKSVATREFQGKSIEGEERIVGPLESLWRILIYEKRLPEKNFSRYLVLMGSLNPQLKDLNVLPVGNTIFIPARPDEVLGIRAPAAQGRSKRYRVEAGDYLYKIVREQMGVGDMTEMKAAVGEVKRLNPGKKNWNLLLVGEVIAIPGARSFSEREPEVPSPPVVESIGLDYGRRLPARENLQLLEQVVKVLGSEMLRNGEDVLRVHEGIIYVDRTAYPVVVNAPNGQKVILDLGGKFPPTLKTGLEGQDSPVPVVSLKPGASLHDAVDGLITRLGFQPVPADRPIMIQDRGVELQVRGEWVAAAPREDSGRQAIWIVSLTDRPGKTPDYLREYLAMQGMHFKEILLPGSSFPSSSFAQDARRQAGMGVEVWPQEKRALTDVLLQSYSVSPLTDQPILVRLRDGIRMDIKADRFFQFAGKKIAVFFRRVGEEVKRALEQEERIQAIELDGDALSTRELISRLAAGLGENAMYRENRFFAVEGSARDKLVLTIPGFFFSARSLFLTDREIPEGLQRFFFDRGLRVAYFP